MEQDYQFADPTEFDLERKKIERRRAIAEQLLATQAPQFSVEHNRFGSTLVSPGAGGAFNAMLKPILGQYSADKADDLEEALAKREAEASRQMLSSIPESGPARIQAQAAAMRFPSLRDAIKAQMAADEAEAKRIEAGEQAAANRVETANEKEANREFLRQQKEADRETRRDIANESNALRREIAGQMHGKESKEAVAARAKQEDADSVLSLLDLAEPLIPIATSSGIGTLADKAGGMVGLSSKSGDAAAQLRAIEGMLVSKMPKMSGPQSDKDVLLYKQMAGQIGDPAVPVSQKQAAAKTIREINSRYAGNPDIQRSPTPGQPVQVRSEAEYQALPSGATYVAPDGNVRRKK